jgi:hypothetical protein
VCPFRVQIPLGLQESRLPGVRRVTLQLTEEPMSANDYLPPTAEIDALPIDELELRFLRCLLEVYGIGPSATALRPHQLWSQDSLFVEDVAEAKDDFGDGLMDKAEPSERASAYLGAWGSAEAFRASWCKSLASS